MFTPTSKCTHIWRPKIFCDKQKWKSAAENSTSSTAVRPHTILYYPRMYPYWNLRQFDSTVLLGPIFFCVKRIAILHFVRTNVDRYFCVEVFMLQVENVWNKMTCYLWHGDLLQCPISSTVEMLVSVWTPGFARQIRVWFSDINMLLQPDDISERSFCPKYVF